MCLRLGVTLLDWKQPFGPLCKRASGLLGSMQGRKRADAQSDRERENCSSMPRLLRGTYIVYKLARVFRRLPLYNVWRSYKGS